MSTNTPNVPSGLDAVLARARQNLHQAMHPPLNPEREAEQAQEMKQAQERAEVRNEVHSTLLRLKEVSTELEDALSEQTLLLAIGRVKFMPAISYQALAKASGLSYSGVRQRLTPEVLEAVSLALEQGTD